MPYVHPRKQDAKLKLRSKTKLPPEANSDFVPAPLPTQLSAVGHTQGALPE